VFLRRAASKYVVVAKHWKDIQHPAKHVAAIGHMQCKKCSFAIGTDSYAVAHAGLFWSRECRPIIVHHPLPRATAGAGPLSTKHSRCPNFSSRRLRNRTRAFNCFLLLQSYIILLQSADSSALLISQRQDGLEKLCLGGLKICSFQYVPDCMPHPI
jgi:hypothetical protein